MALVSPAHAGRIARLAPVLTFLVLLAPPAQADDAPAQNDKKLKVACLGDSITEGSRYPEALQGILGDSYLVRNFGVSGSTLLSKGDRPYIKEGKYRALKEFQPQVVVVMLGTNDTKPRNYAHIADFAKDLTSLIDELSGLTSKPKVLLCKPVPVYGDGNGEIRNGPLKEGVIPPLERVARERGLPVVDLYAALSDHPELFKDNIHPIGGEQLMAKPIATAIRAAQPTP